METLSEPLAEAGLTPLLVYFRGIESFARGDLDAAATQLESIAESGKIEIGGETLPIPESIRARWNLTNESTVADFSDRKLRGRSFKDQDLTGANFSRADLRGANFNGAKLAGANFSNAKMGMQRRWAIWLTIFCFLLALFLSVGIVLVGLSFGWSLTAFDGSYDSSSSTKFSSAVFSNLIRWSSIYVGCAFACFYVTSKRKKSWQTFWQAYTLAFMLSPISLMASTFLTGLSVSHDAMKISMIVSDSLCAVLFGFCSRSLIYKGLKVRWVVSAIALVGFVYLGGAISLAVTASWSSFSSGYLFFLIIALISVFVLIPFLVFQTIVLNIRRRITMLVSSMVIGLGIGAALYLWLPSQDSTARGIVIGIAIAIAIISFLVALTWYGSRSQTLADVFLSISGFALIVTLITTTVIWFATQNPLIALASGLGAFMIFFIFAIPLVWAGVISFRYSTLGIMIVSTAIAIFFGMVLGSTRLIPSDVAGSIALSVAALAGLISGLALAITVALTITIVWAESGDRKFTIIWTSLLIALPLALTGASTLIFIGSSLAVVIVGTAILAASIFQLGIYIGFQAVSGDPKFASIRQAALAITSLCGTNFCDADLSEANFNQSILKSVNFKQANLTHAKWFRAKHLDRASTGDNYLQYPQIQQILTSRKAQGQNFDYLDLRGVNLRRFNLSGASFVGTNLQGADLRQVDLSGSKLINTQLEGANLSGAILTGIYFHDCKFTTSTTLAAVECDYIYTMPDRPNSETTELSKEVRFRTGGFANFVRNMTEPYSL